MQNKLDELLDIINNNAVENSLNEAERVINSQPRYPELNMENNAAKVDCPNFELCKNLQISQENICTKGSDTRYRCSFSESRLIMLLEGLSPIWKKKIKININFLKQGNTGTAVSVLPCFYHYQKV